MLIWIDRVFLEFSPNVSQMKQQMGSRPVIAEAISNPPLAIFPNSFG
jgi:hypothetical protein